MKFKKQYKAEVVGCPYCGSKTRDIQTGNRDQLKFNEIRIHQACKTCGNEWVEVFELKEVIR